MNRWASHGLFAWCLLCVFRQQNAFSLGGDSEWAPYSGGQARGRGSDLPLTGFLKCLMTHFGSEHPKPHQIHVYLSCLKKCRRYRLFCFNSLFLVWVYEGKPDSIYLCVWKNYSFMALWDNYIFLKKQGLFLSLSMVAILGQPLLCSGDVLWMVGIWRHLWFLPSRCSSTPAPLAILPTHL